MNSARNANRRNHDNPSSGERGRGGRLRGGTSTRNHGRQTLLRVPNTQQVVRGSLVSIVLKADQPTGHETQGIVAEILTRGNHPRGVKVRLEGGNVGRVQKMVTIEAVTTASADLSEMGKTENMAVRNNERDQFEQLYAPELSMQSYSNRVPVSLAEPSAVVSSLSDYVVIKTKGKKGKFKAGQESEEQEDRELLTGVSHISDSTTSRCPVCEQFEGDEIAVAHHVNSHFE